MILTIGLRTALITPKIRATASSVSTLEVTEAVVSSMPGTTAVATARAAAEASTRIRNRMPHLGITGSPGCLRAPMAKIGEARPRRALPPARPPAPVRAAGGERDRGPTIVRARAPYDQGVQGCSTAAWLLAPP